MKHIVFNFAEPIVAIQRVRNEVFPSDERVIAVFNYAMLRRIMNVLKDLHIECSILGGSQILLDEEYHIVCNAVDDEFAIVKGKDEMRVLTSEQYFEEFCI